MDFSCPVSSVEFVWKSGSPKEIASYETLLIPLDILTWTLLVISCLCIMVFQIVANILVKTRQNFLKGTYMQKLQ